MTEPGQAAPSGIDGRWWADFRDELDRIAEDARLTDPVVRDREFADLALAVDQPEVFALVEEWRRPFDEHDDDQLPRRAVARRARSRPPLPANVVVPASVMRAIAEHAATAEPGWETVGRIMVGADGRATSYHPLINRADAPGRFSIQAAWRHGPGEASLVIHSHPAGSPGEPSIGDVAWALATRHNPFGVWAAETGTLGVFRASVGGDTYSTVPVSVEHPQERGPRFQVNFNERLVLTASGVPVPGGWAAWERSRWSR